MFEPFVMALTSRMCSVIDNNFSLDVFGEESSVHQSQDIVLQEEGASRGHDFPTGHQSSRRCAGQILQILVPIHRGRWPQGSGPTLAKIFLSLEHKSSSKWPLGSSDIGMF